MSKIIVFNSVTLEGVMQGWPGALFDLADTRTTTTGVIAATYRRTDRGPKGPAS